MALWQDFYNYASRLVRLKEQTDKNTADIKDIQQELRDLTVALQELRFEMRLDRERDDMARQAEAKDRRMLLLEVQNQLLRFERRLPPPSGSTDE